MDGAWWTSSVNFQARQQTLAVEGTRWRVTFHVYAVRLREKGKSKLEFKSTVTLWPADQTKDKDPQLVKGKWYEKCQRKLRRYGYRGAWQESPYGYFGSFEKALDSPQAVAAEARGIDRIRL